LSIEFESSVRGLKIGAPVEYRGLRVGEVTNVEAKVRPNLDGVNDISLIVTITISPTRLGLKSASLITGALFVELVEQPDAPVALFDELAEPYPRLPAIPSDLEDFTASAEGVLNRINAQNLNGLLADARTLISDPGLQAAPGDLAATLAASRALIEDVRDVGAAEALVTALEDASNAAKAFTAASVSVPALVASATTLSGEISELPLTDLVVAATTLLEDASKRCAIFWQV